MSERRAGQNSLGEDTEKKEEDVDSMLERLHLLADVTEVVVMSDDEEDDEVAPVKWSLVGKVLSPTVSHIQTIRAAMKPAWGNPRGLRIRPAGDNAFVADFANRADRDRVLEGTPWMVGRHAVVLQDYDPRLRPSDIRFDSMSIWVRILNLPFEWMNERKGLKIAKLIDKKCVVDVDEFGDASGTFLRAKVAIPIDQPLRRWVTVRREGRDESFNLQYEKLPFYCFSCGLIGHGELECKAPADRDAAGRLPFDRGLRAPEEHRRRVQSFGQAAASASWHSGSKDRAGSSKKSAPNTATSRTSGDGEKLKPGEQVVSSPPAKTTGTSGSNKVAEIARKLFPGSVNPQVQTPKKRKPSEVGTADGGLAMEGGRIVMIDNDQSLALVPVGDPQVRESEPSRTGFVSGQGKEKKHRSGKLLRNQEGLKEINMITEGENFDAGLPIQPCNDQ